MLNFFRKYQKILFLFVTIIVVTSFVFFGTYQAFAPAFQNKEEKAFDTLDDKKVTVEYLGAFTHFLGTPLTMREGISNFLHDDFIVKEILESEGYSIVLERLFANEKFQEEQAKRLAKEKLFRPYAHAQHPMLSVENIWTLFAPDLKACLQEVQGYKDPCLESFKARVRLFLAERKFPPELLSYVLNYQAKDAGLALDSSLKAENLSIFHYHTLEDWFGPTFVQECATWVLQGAAWARKLGHKVSSEEVIVDICFRQEKAFESNPQLKKHFGSAGNYYNYCLKALGISEPILFKMTEELLLFRRLWEGIANSALVDNYSLHRFYDKVNLACDIELYHLPKEYVPSSEEELKKFESYYQRVAAVRENSLDIPEKIDPVEEIEKRAPELVSTVFEVDVQSVTLEELAAKVSLKESWEWERTHSDLLKEHFPTLKTSSLEDLKKEERRLVDAFARLAIVKDHPEWVIEALKGKSAHAQKLVFGQKPEVLEGISDPAALRALLEEKGPQGPLVAYTQDERHFYTLTLKAKEPEKVVLSYVEAANLGLLGKLLHQSEYEKVVATLEGQWGKRGAYLLEKAKNSSTTLPIIKKEERIFTEGGIISFAEATSVPEGAYSPLSYSPEIGCYYFKNLGVRRDTTLPMSTLLQEQRMIGAEIKCHLFRQLLEQLSK